MTKPTGITVDVRAFALVSAIDTCSIWNLLSSPCLLGAALRKKRSFVVASYIRYEALEKPRTRPTSADLALHDEFRRRLAKKQGFFEVPMTVSELQAIANLPDVCKLGRGEIAALALARKLRSAILSEDSGARRVARMIGVDPVQTTPHLLGWLLYEGELTDGDVSTVISEHEAHIGVGRGRLTVYLQRIYQEACRCRLLRDGYIVSSAKES